MASISQYLAELDKQRDSLAANLTAMGVSAAADEKLNTLVPKVLQIPQTGSPEPSKTVLFNAENHDGIYLKFNNEIYGLDEFTTSHQDFFSPENEYALNYGTAVFGWDYQAYTCCIRPVMIKPSMQIAMRFLAGSTEAGIMRLVQSENAVPADILTAAQTEGSYTELPLQWIYSSDYVTTLTPCEGVETGEYYLVWVGRSNNSHPLIKSIEIYP